MKPYSYLARALRHVGFGKRALTAVAASVSSSANAFKPPASNARELGFLDAEHAARFAEACSTLKLSPASTPGPGYGKRSFSARVTDRNGKGLWLKVFGLTSPETDRWKAELAADAMTGIRKPGLIEQLVWQHENEFWVARLSTFASGVIESGPWAENGADAVQDAWIETLKHSLEALALEPCDRTHIQPALFERWLSRHFRRRIETTPSDWVASHNDLQWSNLAHPDLCMLDWEWFGRSPRGYDQGMLIAYSCHNDALTARLERAFRLSFESEIGHYGKLFAAHTIRNSIESGWLNPAMRAPVGRLIERWESEIR